MLRRLTAALGLLLAISVPAAAQTAEEIVAKSIAAQGGLEKIKAVQTRRLTATMSLQPQALDAPVVIEAKRPNKLRVTVTVNGVENIEGFDGETAWMLAPAQNMPAPGAAPPGEAKALRDEADFDGPLVEYEAKGHALELVGKEPVQTKDAWKLKVTLKGGDVQYVYIDAATYLPVKLERMRDVMGRQVKAVTISSDYKDEGGVIVPHTAETTTELQGTTFIQKVVITKVEQNVSLEDARFTMPAAKVK